MYTGPKLINDNLVFGYDTGYGVADNITPTRFYKGAPTTNPIHGQNAVAQNSYTTYSATSSGNWNANHPKAIRAYNAGGGDITGYYNSGVGDAANTHHAHWQLDPILKKPVVVMNDRGDAQWKAKSYGTGLGTWTSQGKTYGDTYTISWLQWVDDLSKNARTGLYTQTTSGSNGFHDGQSTSASSYNTKLRTWQRVYQTYTTANSRNLNHSMASIYMYGHYSPRAVVKVADVQWQWGSTPFPFSETSERSSTASLIDLKKTTDINVSNVSFDSTGQPTLDGTDDYIYPNNITNGSGFTSITAEFVVKASANNKNIIKSNNNAILLHYGGAGFYLNSTDSTTSGYLGWNGKLTGGTGVYEHLVATWDGTTMKLYVNGESTGTTRAYSGGSTGVLRDLNGVVIGGHFNNTQPYFNGDIPIARIYSNALSAEKIKQNYSAYKKRFNLQ